MNPVCRGVGDVAGEKSGIFSLIWVH